MNGLLAAMLSNRGSLEDHTPEIIHLPTAKISSDHLSRLIDAKKPIFLIATDQANTIEATASNGHPSIDPGKSYPSTDYQMEWDRDILTIKGSIEDEDGLLYKYSLAEMKCPLRLDVARMMAVHDELVKVDLLAKMDKMDRLMADYADNPVEFKDGDYVTWKEDMWPGAGSRNMIAVMYKFGDCTELKALRETLISTNGICEDVDCIIAFRDRTGDLAFSPSCSKRLKRVDRPRL